MRPLAKANLPVNQLRPIAIWLQMCNASDIDEPEVKCSEQTINYDFIIIFFQIYFIFFIQVWIRSRWQH